MELLLWAHLVVLASLAGTAAWLLWMGFTDAD
jgi:hypothetical protein